MRNITGIIIHCTATNPSFMPGHATDAKVKEIRRWHVEDRGWSDIGYHYLIDRDGTIAHGRPMERDGAHVRGHNKGTVGIAIFGGRTSTTTDAFSDNFTPQQEDSLKRLIHQLQDTFGPVKVSGHNEYANKACPGFNASAWFASSSKPILSNLEQPVTRVENPVMVPPAQPAGIPQEFRDLIDETKGEGSKTDILNQVIQWLMGGGILTALPSLKSISADVHPIVIGAAIIAAAIVFGVATYTRSSRKRKGAKAQRAEYAIKAMDGTV